MSRETYAFRRFAVALDTEPDAEPVTFSMQCAVCDESGRAVEVGKEVADEARAQAEDEAAREAAGWVELHRATHRGHFTYRLVQSRPYHLVPGAWERCST